VEIVDIAYVGVIGIAITAGASIIVAMIARWRSAGQDAVEASDAIDKLVLSINSLAEQLEKERAARKRDVLALEQELRAQNNKSTEIERRAREAQRELEATRAELEETRGELVELRNYYEDKIARIEQAHRDRVHSLKARIKALEVENGTYNGLQDD